MESKLKVKGKSSTEVEVDVDLKDIVEQLKQKNTNCRARVAIELLSTIDCNSPDSPFDAKFINITSRLIASYVSIVGEG